ncbi:MAG: Type 1 glutamine amidotransferase-like domain-containing protein [Actinomycetota bacterium]|nr:Type 1 glutamine amidotransferase-like domain-containing protein [Actinomycetota bacterium]
MTKHGPLALVGGCEWRAGCTFDAALLAESGGSEVLVLPTAAAYEHAERKVTEAAAHFAGLGATVRGLMVLHRHEAEDESIADIVSKSSFIYLSGGSPMHLRSVLKDSALWDALVGAWRGGAVLAGSAAGAMVLCDPMVDPRGGAFTLGLGLLPKMALIPHHDTWSTEKAKRTITLAPARLPIVALDEQTALVRRPDTSWAVEGAGKAVVFQDGKEVGLEALPR